MTQNIETSFYVKETELKQELSFGDWKLQIDLLFKTSKGFDKVDVQILNLFYGRKTNLTLSGFKAYAFPVLVGELRKFGVSLTPEGIRKKIKKISSYGLLREKIDPFRRSKWKNVRFYYPIENEEKINYIENSLKSWIKLG